MFQKAKKWILYFVFWVVLISILTLYGVSNGFETRETKMLKRFQSQISQASSPINYFFKDIKYNKVLTEDSYRLTDAQINCLASSDWKPPGKRPPDRDSSERIWLHLFLERSEYSIEIRRVQTFYYFFVRDQSKTNPAGHFEAEAQCPEGVFRNEI